MGLACPAMMWAIAEGQMAPLLAASLFLAFSTPPVAKGVIVAVILSIKPQFAFIVPIVLWSDRRAFLAMSVTGTVLLASYVAILGPDVWLDWFDARAQIN